MLHVRMPKLCHGLNVPRPVHRSGPVCHCLWQPSARPPNPHHLLLALLPWLMPRPSPTPAPSAPGQPWSNLVKPGQTLHCRHHPVLDEEDAATYDFPGLRLGRDDAWAEQLWREMQQRRSRGSSQPAIGAGEAWFLFLLLQYLCPWGSDGVCSMYMDRVLCRTGSGRFQKPDSWQRHPLAAGGPLLYPGAATFAVHNSMLSSRAREAINRCRACSW